MKIILLTVFSLSLFIFSMSIPAANNGLVSLQSHQSVNKTTTDLLATLKKKGMTVFATIDHASNAAKIGLTLRPTRLIIFGNPKIGSKLMACNQSVAIDLPQKYLIAEDEKGQVWITYNAPGYLAQRHDLVACSKIIAKISKALNGIAQTAID